MYTTIILLLLSASCGWCVGDWRPVGQGDPLIDPTHVYSPPHVQHVHYWLKAPSLSLEPPPSRISELSHVAGWPQISSHYHTIVPSTTPISITTMYSTPEFPPAPHFTTLEQNQNFVLQSSGNSVAATTYFTTSVPLYASSTTTTTPATTTSATTATTSTTTPSTTTSTVPPPFPPVSFVIQGHSKVKKYGPLPESANSIHNVNHNYLTSKKV